MPARDTRTLYLFDGTHTIFRMYHAIRGLRSSSGEPTNAIHGFGQMLLKLIRETRPSHIGMVFDPKGKTFRHEEFPEYKAQRKPPEPDMIAQVEPIKELVRAFGLPVLEQPGFEADDVIGTVAELARKAGIDVVIVGSDKDLMQLITEGVSQLDPVLDKRYGPAEVEEKWGVPPERIVDLLGLAGDTSDNLPGVAGVGPKTAVSLIREFGGFEEVIAGVTALEKKKKVHQKIVDNAEQGRMTYRLATIRRDVEIDATLDDLEYSDFDPEKLRPLLERWELKRLLAELTPREGVKREGYRTVTDLSELKKFLARCKKDREISFDFETTSTSPTRADLVGLALARFAKKGDDAFAEVEAIYVPVGHTGLVVTNVPVGEVLAAIRPLLEDPEIRKIGQNLKYEEVILTRGTPRRPKSGEEPQRIVLADPIEDTMLMSYLLDAGRQRHSLDAIAQDHLAHETIHYEDVCGKGKKQIPFSEVPVDRATEYACEDAHVALAAQRALAPQVEAAGLDGLYREMELPLVHILAAMERHGVLLDRDALAAFSADLGQRIRGCLASCQELAGDPAFNPNSPKQLAHILYDELGLPVVKRTKTGPSTAQPVLEELARRVGEQPLVTGVLEYRSLTKLKGTYSDALAELVGDDGRIHTSFNQHITATGRLSSSDPNLQNIPVRTEDGRKIRAAFVAPEGKVLLAADYSQVELRVLAHLSGDERLRDAFARGEDIHRRTAAEVLGLEPEDVTSGQRRQAKAVNFGVVYGQSAFGLSRQLGIDQKEAQRFIDAYFERYNAVRGYWDDTLAFARERGYIETLMGRRRHLPDLQSSNQSVRQGAERAAINTPIQGSAADLIKLAMLRVPALLAEERFAGATLVLQVHDELVFEVPEARAEALAAEVRALMENVWELSVPLVVDTNFAPNWAEAH